MKRRTKIRIASFSVALFSVMLIWGISASVSAHNYKRLVSLSQQRALIQMCEYLDNIEADLTKSQYTESGAMLATLSSDLHKQATGAKASLSALSSGDTQLYNMYKFFSQVGEYTAALNTKAANGGSITAKERATLKKLLEYAATLSTQFDYLSSLMQSEWLSFEALKNTLEQADDSSESMVSFIDAAADAEDSMTDFPSLIYDGPFSDNIMNKNSVLLENADEITPEKAKQLAAAYLSADESKIAAQDDSNGKIASYVFLSGTKRVAVTKKGGYCAYILSETTAGEESISIADATEKAIEFLYNCGYTDMVSSYHAENDGICTINFAYKKGTYICYPDLIKVSVSLSTGEITGMDASDFIMNHVERDIPPEVLTEDAAAEKVAESLTVKKTQTAVIPTDGGNENFAYEFLCEDENGQTVLVYIDTQNGKEDDILILLFTDNGTLTK